MRHLVALVLSLAAAASGLAADAFLPPWIGYDAGSSAFPGNPAPFERDPTALVTADLDGDGWLDVAVSNLEYAAPGGGTDGLSGFVVLFNERDGTFSEAVHTTVSAAGSWDITAGDFDEDGDQDLVVPIANTFWEGSTVRVYFNDGQGGFPSYITLSAPGGPVGVTAADLDGDTHLDLAVACYHEFEEEGTITILLGTGAGAFAAPTSFTVPRRPYRVAAAHLDQDEHLDLAVAHEWQTVSVHLGTGGGSFAAPEVHSQLFPPQGGYYPCLALADVDQDQDLDIFYGNTRSHPVAAGTGRIVHLRNEGGSFVRDDDIMLTYGTAGPVDISTGDIDGNGWPDLLAVHHSARRGDGPIVIRNDGAGGFLPAVLTPAGQGTFAAVFADIDGDLDDDVLTADRYSMMVTVHPNDGGHLRDLPPLHAAQFANTRLDVGDVDGDGDLDAFTSCESTGGPGALFRNHGDGTFAPGVPYTHSDTYGRGAGRAKLRDLDGDGDLDLLYNDPHTDFHDGYDFHVALNDGEGNFGPIVQWELNTCGNGDVDAFDLDGDGDLDVVNLEELACAGGGGGNRLYISLNHGDATFAAPFTVDIDTGPHNVAGGDLNGDAHIDLVTVHYMPYGLRDFVNVHLGNGDGSFQPEIRYEVGQGPRWLVLADLDGDTHLDIATANTGQDDIGRETMTVLLGTGQGTFGGRTDYYAPFAPDLLGSIGLAAYDIDADQDIDLLLSSVANSVAVFRNDGSGQFTVEPRLGFWWDPWSVTVGDFTGDGAMDLAAVVSGQTGESSRALAVFAGQGVVTAVGDGEEPVRRSSPFLSPVFPNPVGETARFSLSVPRSQPVRVSLYDLRGRAVREVFAGSLQAGAPRQFAFARGGLASGLYFVRVKGETFSATRPVMIVR